MAHLVIQTESGSIYHLRHVNGKWFLSSPAHVVTDRSKDICADEWEVEIQAEPVIGMPLQAFAPLSMDKDDPARIPGGGKITSPIVSIDLV